MKSVRHLRISTKRSTKCMFQHLRGGTWANSVHLGATFIDIFISLGTDEPLLGRDHSKGETGTRNKLDESQTFKLREEG